jgi:Holliday junction DNA helicase RuvA
MIARVRGVLADKQPTRVVIDCSGIGLDLAVPLSTSRRLAEVGQEVALLVQTRFTREGVELFGFLDYDERDMFRRITAAKGIGPKAGLNLLSRLTPAELTSALAAGKIDIIRSVPGIGPKKAEALMKHLQGDAPTASTEEPMLADAVSALMSLGLSRREAREKVARVQLSDTMTLQDLLRLALAYRGT